MKRFGSRLKKARTAIELSQTQLANRIGHNGVSARSYISALEAGHKMPSLPVFVRLAKALHVSADYLLGLKPGAWR